MIPRLEAYYRPETLADALALLATLPRCEVLAGGTDLLLTEEPHQALVDITRLGLATCEVRDGDLHLGATLRVEDLLASPLAAAWADGVLVGACLEFGTLQVRNMATVGGNVAHALPAADLVPALMALEAEVELARAGEAGGVQTRRLPLDGFAIAPFRTLLESGELIVALHVPARTRSWRAQFRKVGRVRKDLAQVNCAVAIELGPAGVTQARVVLGAVHPTVTRVPEAEQVLVGGHPGTSDWEQRTERAVLEVRRFVQPITDLRATREWRRHVSGVLVARCLRHASDPARAGRAPRLADGPSYCAGIDSEVGA